MHFPSFFPQAYRHIQKVAIVRGCQAEVDVWSRFGMDALRMLVVQIHSDYTVHIPSISIDSPVMTKSYQVLEILLPSLSLTLHHAEIHTPYLGQFLVLC